MHQLETAVSELNKAEFCCILSKNNCLYKADGIGVKPLVTWLNEDIHCFKGGAIADKVIGKAAALLIVLGGAKSAYGAVMSRAAADILKANKIIYSYGELVPFITNRAKNGICPLEESVAKIDEPVAALAAIRAKIATLMEQA